jgi:DNA mismatch repair protein MutS
VKEVGDRIIFLRKLKPGGSEHSFGIHVAQMAGMPNSIVLRADEILHFLEKDKRKSQEKKMREVPRDDFQLMLFDNDPKIKQVKEMLDALDINTMSPVEALLKLNEFKGLLGK